MTSKKNRRRRPPPANLILAADLFRPKTEEEIDEGLLEVAMTERQERCETCRFWTPAVWSDGAFSGLGACDEPIVHDAGEERATVPDFWCGEWEAESDG